VSRNVPAGYDIRDFPTFAVTVDIVILSVVEGELLVLLIERKAKPFKKAWALPGGFKRPDETLDEAARRELREETGVDAPKHLAQFGAYGDPKRDPRGNVVTVGYLAVTPEVGEIMAGTDASDARLWPVAKVLDGALELAFDHRRILVDAIERAAADLESSDLATGSPAMSYVEPTGVRAESGGRGGRPPELFSAGGSWTSDGSPVKRPRKRGRAR
jgi:8-oxo-dGTP diphosphatase